MSCTNPLLAVDYGINPVDRSKHLVKVLIRPDQVNTIQQMRQKYELSGENFKYKLMLIPCGKCAACRLKRRKEWSVRCQMESLYHKESCFVTLTYDNEHYPGHLVKSDFQGFIKSLRNHGFKVRYFGCGEYGSLGRGHYHLILFGYIPSDLVFHSRSKCGFPQFTSKFLESIWSKGFVTVSDFSPEVAGYTAGYCDKKFQFEDFSDDHDVPEFLLMSTRPGIGRQYVEDHLGQIYQRDSLVINFGTHKFGVPRYFDKVAVQKGLYIDDVKELRGASCSSFEEIRIHGLLSEEELFFYKDNLYKQSLSRKVRSL